MQVDPGGHAHEGVVDRERVLSIAVVSSQVKSSDFVNDTVTPNTAAVRLSPVTSDTKRPLE